jgi:hypothetical protein
MLIIGFHDERGAAYEERRWITNFYKGQMWTTAVRMEPTL